ncbi:MAG: hypothetical protein PF961_20950 [Planctomycetota bacterium]|jgi:hypothetical protein|nr:hypothetical protein [Planctomycetota bacterium]
MRAVLLCILLSALGSLPAHGDLSERIAILDTAITSNPDDSEALRERADLHRQHGDYQAALDDLDRATHLAPQPVTDAFARGRVLREAGRSFEALETLERCLSLQPDHTPAHIEAALAAADAGQWASAAQHWDACWDRLDPLRPQQVLDRALAHRLHAGGGPNAELAILEQGLERLGPLPVLSEAAIQAAAAAGDVPRALKHCRSGKSRAQRPETWLAREADLLASIGDHEGATLCRQQAITAIDGLPANVRARPATVRLREELVAALR